jgi:hypothetical protein
VLFTGEVVRIVDSQEAKTKPFKALKVVKMNKNLTRGKFERCMIDSVTLIVRDQDTPFIPYLERQPGLDNNSYQKSFITQTDIPIKVTYHKGQHSFIFTMNNVNRLRASDYTDAQVVKYFTNYILDFFDHRVSLDAIALQGIDLCRIVEEGDQLVELVQTGAIQCREQRDHNGQLLDSFRLSDIKEGTVYLNCSSVSTSAFTIAVYRPINKTNEFRYVDPKAIKIELRLRGRSIPSMYAFGMVPSVDDLLQWLKEDPRYLQKVFHSSLMSRIEKSPVGFEVDEVQKTA